MPKSGVLENPNPLTFSLAKSLDGSFLQITFAFTLISLFSLFVFQSGFCLGECAEGSGKAENGDTA